MDGLERTSSLSFRDLPDMMVRMFLAVSFLVTADGGPWKDVTLHLVWTPAR